MEQTTDELASSHDSIICMRLCAIAHEKKKKNMTRHDTNGFRGRHPRKKSDGEKKKSELVMKVEV